MLASQFQLQTALAAPSATCRRLLARRLILSSRPPFLLLGCNSALPGLQSVSSLTGFPGLYLVLASILAFGILFDLRPFLASQPVFYAPGLHSSSLLCILPSGHHFFVRPCRLPGTYFGVLVPATTAALAAPSATLPAPACLPPHFVILSSCWLVGPSRLLRRARSRILFAAALALVPENPLQLPASRVCCGARSRPLRLPIAFAVIVSTLFHFKIT